MKKTGSLLLAALLLTLIWLPTAAIATASSSSLPLRVEMEGIRIDFSDAQPFVDKSARVQVPIRFISEALGANVEWNEETKTITVKQDTNVITLVLGQKSFNINGQMKEMNTAAQRDGSRIFVPLRFVNEALGTYVKWDSAVRTVYISKTPFEPVDEKKKEPPKNEKVVVEDMYGFKVKKNTGSGLDIVKGTGNTGPRESALLEILITFPELIEGVDYKMQVQEVEDVLSQHVEEDTLKAIMKYIKKKTIWDQELKAKFFEDSKYSIFVGSSNGTPIDVTVFNKKK